MTTDTLSKEDLVKKVQYLESELTAEKKQSDVNLSYANLFEKALEDICALLGWKPPTGSCMGAPPEELDTRAVRLVKENLGAFAAAVAARAPTDYVKSLERELFILRRQEQVNSDHAIRYEDALENICSLLNLSPSTSSFGEPSEDVSVRALRLVKEKLGL